MSNELQALTAACLAAPEDDLPKRVLADWLEENRRPRDARLVRLL